MELNNFGFNDNDFIHCSTEKEAIEVLKIAHERGFDWNSGISYLNETYWDRYEDNICYNFYLGVLGTIKIIETNNNNIIIPADKFLRTHNVIINNHKPYLVWN